MESASTVYDHVLAVLDCCHSGSALTWTSSRPIQPGDIDREVPTVNESRCVLAACRPEQYAYEETATRHGYFTARMIDGLLGNAVDFEGDVTLLGLYEYITRSLPESVQTPVFKGDVAGTVIIGRGLPPRLGAPIDKKEVQATLAKAQRLIDEYLTLKQRELRESDYKKSTGWHNCATHLEPIYSWFEETEKALPDIAREQSWNSLQVQLREARRELSDVSLYTETSYGRVVRAIGHGGYGYVWEVARPDTPTSLALKIFHGNELDQLTKVRRFINGYDNMRKLDHPRIVRVHQLSLTPLGFTMDAVPGDDLRRAYIHRDDPEQVLRLLIEVAETIQHAHSRGVKHRDIKPENIIVVTSETGTLTPFLTDFDLAYHETNRTLTTNLGVGGVINYAAPEQLHEPNTHAARAETVDIFSLAQLLFFVVVGRDPSADRFDDNQKLLVKSLNLWVDDRAAAPLIELYQKATQRQPENRPTMSEVVDLLSTAEAYILAASGHDDVNEEDFCRRVAYLYAGLGNYSATTASATMNSLSGQVTASVRLLDFQERRGALLELDLSVAEKIPIPSLKSGTSARDALNGRLDRILKKFPNAKRHNGKKGQYQVFVKADNVPLTIAGVVMVRDILQTAISGIESW